MNKFTFLINKKKYKDVKQFVFVGCLSDFQLQIIKIF